MTDFRRVVRFAFFGRIGKGVIRSILTTLGVTLNNMLSGFKVLFDSHGYDIGVTPQVWSIERMLNDEFDSVLRRIYIDEYGTRRGRFFYRATDPEYKKFYFLGAFFVADTRYVALDGFTVVLPTDITASDKMKALINRYKLVGMSYRIINT